MSEPLPPLPSYARGDWTEVSDVISFDDIWIVPGPGSDKFTREMFVRGAARMLYGDRADEIVEHWRRMNMEAERE